MDAAEWMFITWRAVCRQRHYDAGLSPAVNDSSPRENRLNLGFPARIARIVTAAFGGTIMFPCWVGFC